MVQDDVDTTWLLHVWRTFGTAIIHRAPLRQGPWYSLMNRSENIHRHRPHAREHTESHITQRLYALIDSRLTL